MNPRSTRVLGVLSLLCLIVAGVMASPAAAHPPDCTRATANPNILWPPNHKMVLIKITVPDSSVDFPPNPNVVTITGVTQDEPLNSTGDGNTSPDATLAGGNKVYVRAERKGNAPKDGRVYRISFTATDINGSCTGSVTVGVPHDQGGRKVPIDSGQFYNSLG
jgi:hypothetical protein